MVFGGFGVFLVTKTPLGEIRNSFQAARWKRQRLFAQVGSQSISPFYWSIESGSLICAKARRGGRDVGLGLEVALL